ncbi:carboxy terminal-processing peptidase [Pseudobacteriovorax antillogorgiicola]|uniref:Carboxyl-terminal processing protease n=1 Tax=Pseudobacteriovorax antillogorgiicola TaxID=1513793 RepID=A0A1Y6BU37_9BACT|nr:carboxy terminal-processing peptidase [Pseudobacteriovorax antillogorgiicola]TCS53866.1 carboxyl-terminal processing protease [Pseudobacteriovorax antillogorgiicola]SMF21386.1 carboxyl-terminal processing protease [Pseudobacteriovorax antillogorgiicola]
MTKLKAVHWRTLLLAGLFSFSLFQPGKALSLSCSEVRQLTLLYFKMHFSYSNFDDEISSRTLENFVKAWDPWKLYFYKSDVEEIRSKYSKKLDDMIYGDLDCSAVDFIMNRYSKRLKERHKHVSALLKKKYDFTVDEYMMVDRDKLDFGSSTEEVNERWRKRVKFQLLNLKTSVGDVEKAKEKLEKRYELALKRHNELTKDRVLGIFLNSFSASLDPHSSYMPAEELEDFRIRTRLSLEGIGASLRSEDGFTIVVSLVKGGAAKKGGLLRVNDKIIAVAQGDGEPVDVIDMDLQEVVKKIRGARGTIVKLTVIRETSKKSQKLVIPIVRERIQLVEQQASSEVIEVVSSNANGRAGKKLKIGVLTLPSFYIDFEGRQKRLSNYRSSANDAKREIRKLQEQKIDALVVDLRNNGGGSLEESINMAGIFFDEGPVVQIKTGDGEVETYYDRDGRTYYDGPLLVMINRHSASASEIFAGAIQDYDRGLIVGDHHTFGKGTVQNLNDLAPKLGAIKVTVNQFYRASGASTQLEGVVADINLPSLVDELEIGEKFYDYALPYEKIKTAKYKEFKLVDRYLPEIKKRSEMRVEKDPKFKEVRDEIEKFTKNKEERSRVSLKEKKDDEEKEDEKLAEEENTDEEYSLQDDIYMQETLKIASDYISLLKGKKPVGSPSIPVLVEKAKPAKASKAVSENSKKEEKK